MSVVDDHLVDPKLSLLDKTRIQAQVLMPVLRTLRAELGKAKADALMHRGKSTIIQSPRRRQRAEMLEL
jgi:hypothetical protein